MTETNCKPTELLFHYTTKEAALEHILPDMLLKMGKYSKSNDPKESKAWETFTFDPGKKNKHWSKYWDALEEILRVQNGTRTLCLTEDCKGDPGGTAVDKRGHGLSRMWAQYAGGHTGVCLGLDATLLGQAIRDKVPSPGDLRGDKVLYPILSEENPRENVDAYDIDVTRGEAMREHVKTHAKTFFFKKAQDWQDEREYRWVYCGKPDDSEFLVPIGASLKQVALGVDFPRVYIPMVKDICKQVGARVVRMYMFRGRLDHEYDTN